MLLQRILNAALWLGAVAAGLVICAVWLVDTQSGKISAWAILPFFWGAAAFAVLVHYLGQLRDPIGRYLSRHKPLAGPRPGAELPG
jgi:hypothetical protein